MKNRAQKLNKTLIFAPMAISLIALSCGQERSQSLIDQPAGNLPPSVPVAVAPVDGATDVTSDFSLSWTATDPENDPISYNLYFGRESTPVYASDWSSDTIYCSPWARRSASLQFLSQIMCLQRAYHEVYHSYCSNGASAAEGDSTLFTNLGLVPAVGDDYCYTITSSIGSYSCIVSGNIDYDPQMDVWRSGSPIECLWDDIGLPFETNATYYWQIIARDSHGNQTVGPIWRFTTAMDTLAVNGYPDVPVLILPSQNSAFSLDELNFVWSCSDPEGDALTYDLYLGTSPANLPAVSHSQEAVIASPWKKQSMADEMLLLIYQRQTSYRDQFGAYCLDGARAWYGNDAFGPELGIFIDSLDTYVYRMWASESTFVCEATCNLDSDVSTDIRFIDDWGIPTVFQNDLGFPIVQPGTVFYWRVAAHDSHGHSTFSPIWVFAAD
jgi:hypothetical protein